jgi:hypothetical protein
MRVTLPRRNRGWLNSHSAPGARRTQRSLAARLPGASRRTRATAMPEGAASTASWHFLTLAGDGPCFSSLAIRVYQPSNIVPGKLSRPTGRFSVQVRALATPFSTGRLILRSPSFAPASKRFGTRPKRRCQRRRPVRELPPGVDDDAQSCGDLTAIAHAIKFGWQRPTLSAASQLRGPSSGPRSGRALTSDSCTLIAITIGFSRRFAT